ncbi:von Willebrand factor C domain-containing protein 2-like [Ylistrum balloti]|uniref:von Willebrand factor C domain-containing protein 2-like n=1 Tax=Ylistrum balloti TaxID=509963 RepID=UPI0029058124|nr:von Willebrand factor C domain-containing protein 2-like [Ylistrum balloti]
MDVVILFFGVTVLNTATSNIIPTPLPPELTCWWNGTEYHDGEHFSQSCFARCECQRGHISCIYADCSFEPPPCADPVTPKCGCPHCPNGANCGYGNVTIPAGQQYRVDERTLCSCLEGGKPALCKPLGCTYMGKMYFEEVFHPSPCLECHCNVFTHISNCSLNNCIIKPLECVDAVVEPGTCCHVCPNGPNCFVGNKKISAGTDYNDGSQICRCPDPDHNLLFGSSSGPQAVCSLIGPAPPHSGAI